MNDNFEKLEKKKILSILGSNREMYKMCSAKIYSSNKNGETWLYSDLEGFLCFVLDYTIKTRFFVMFDPTTYERLFQFELYNNFEKEYQKLADDFFCFEIGNGFIGFQFENSKEASELQDIIKKFNDFLVDNLFDANLKSNNVYNYKKQEKIDSYMEIIKENFSAGKNKFDENYIEDGMEIRKPRYFELLNNISFDRDKKEFKIGKLPQEFKEMFKNIGIKKSDIKDPKSALNILKNVMDILDNQLDESDKKIKFGNAFQKTISKLKNKRKKSVDSTNSTNASLPINTNKTYGEDKDKENTIVIGNDNLMNSDSHNKNIPSIPNIPNVPVSLSNITSNNKNNSNSIQPSNIPNISSIPNIPSIPAVPKIPAVPNLPSVPKVPNAPSINNASSSSSNSITPPSQDYSATSFISKEEELTKIKLKPVSNKSNQQSGNMLDEMKNVVLKKIDSTVNDKKTKITQNETNHLQSSLAMAIKQRRIEITKHEVDDSFEESDEWSD